MIQTSWTPNFNKSNRAIGTFLGVEYLNGQTKTGVDFEYIAALFTVEGSKGNETTPQNLEVRLSENYAPGNRTATFAKSLGFVFVQEFEEDNRGLQVPVKDNLHELDEMFESLEGTTYSFRMRHDRQTGLWDIIVPSIREFTISEVTSSNRPKYQGTAAN